METEKKVDHRYPHLSSSFFFLSFFPPPKKRASCQRGIGDAVRGGRRCARRCFPNGEAKRKLIVPWCRTRQRKIIWSCHKITLAFIAARLALALCSGPFVKQMQTRSWDSLPPKVAARTSLSQSLQQPAKIGRIYTVYDHLQIVRITIKKIFPPSFSSVHWPRARERKRERKRERRRRSYFPRIKTSHVISSPRFPSIHPSIHPKISVIRLW